ncbi:GNAT family N-acetyltransferase [Candidatus Nomurabacteria bacterium]|nr:GNAT family N-acetyltransferase [Candidatus Kaiserbacteria bacterium]MCB9815377.1 GNAT family N-acetyltransferase [Candidatus Nomurabacteria bacterium]
MQFLDSQTIVSDNQHKIVFWINTIEQYQELMGQLHSNFTIQPALFQYLCKDTHTLLVFTKLLETGALVSTAQANLIPDLVTTRAMINNVVTHRDCRSCGYGRITMEYLERRAVELWKVKGQSLRLFLTNSPSKRNSGFYVSLGYRPLTDPGVLETTGYTVLWCKDM